MNIFKKLFNRKFDKAMQTLDVQIRSYEWFKEEYKKDRDRAIESGDDTARFKANTNLIEVGHKLEALYELKRSYVLWLSDK